MALSSALRKTVSTAVSKYSRSDGSRLKPKEGRNFYRFLAPLEASWVGPEGQFWADLGVHWIKMGLKEKPIAVVGSRDVCYQEPCPVGTAVAMAFANAGDDDTKAIIKEMQVTKSVLFNVIDRTTNVDNQEVEILELRPTAAQQVLDMMIQHDDAGEDMTDLKTGVDICITRSGKGMDTKYTANVRAGASKAVAPTSLAKCIDLHDHIAKEFFRGDETKALTAIQQISGIALPQIGTTAKSAALTDGSVAAAKAARTPTPALASTSVAVDDADVLEALEDAPVTAVSDEDAELAAAELAMAELKAKAAARKAAAATEAAAVAAKPVAKAVAATAAPAATTLSAADVEDVLAELDSL